MTNRTEIVNAVALSIERNNLDDTDDGELDEREQAIYDRLCSLHDNTGRAVRSRGKK